MNEGWPSAEGRDRLQPLAIDFPVSLWLVDLTILPASREVTWLARAEVNRAVRFRDTRARSRYLAAHVALRLVVAREHGVAPERQIYECNPLGRWRLVDADDLDFSLSYAGSRAMIALSRGERIGLDVECSRHIIDADQLVEICLNSVEQRDYAEIPAKKRSTAFLQAWTRKEAALKAIGSGLQQAPESLHTGLAERWCVWTPHHRLEIMSFEESGLIGGIARIIQNPTSPTQLNQHD